MSILKLLNTTFEIHPFLLELLEKNGFNTVTKLQLIDEDAIKAMVTGINLGEYTYVKDYDEKQFDKFFEKPADDTFTLRLTVGDFCLLKKIPEMIKLLPVEKVKKKIKKYAPKRKSKDIEETDENEENDVNVANQPPLKQKRIQGDEAEVSDKFAVYADKIAPDMEQSIVYSTDKDPVFAVVCAKCTKKVIISYKVTKKMLPCWVKTNWINHPCNKKEQLAHQQGLNVIVIEALVDNSNLDSEP